MKELEERILKEGKVVDNNILRVDTFISHQVDPVLMEHIGDEFAAHFKDKGITKVVTIESSGISPALMAALKLNVPLIIMKKHQSKALNSDTYNAEVTSFTTGYTYDLSLAKNVVSEDDHVLIIDDFLADGEALTAAIRLLRMAHSTIAGVGILIEKAFQSGPQKLRSQGFEVFSLAKIKQMDDIQITFLEN